MEAKITITGTIQIAEDDLESYRAKESKQIAAMLFEYGRGIKHSIEAEKPPLYVSDKDKTKPKVGG
jgi:hypothetical protein